MIKDINTAIGERLTGDVEGPATMLGMGVHSAAEHIHHIGGEVLGGVMQLHDSGAAQADIEIDPTIKDRQPKGPAHYALEGLAIVAGPLQRQAALAKNGLMAVAREMRRVTTTGWNEEGLVVRPIVRRP